MENTMKKIIATLSIVFAVTFAAEAQVFIIDEDIDNPRVETEEFDINNPGFHGSGSDWYLPLGDGALLLAALGGAYLLNKKRKK